MVEESALRYGDKCERVSAISKPLATEKVYKKIGKLLKKAHERKTCTRRGVKDVAKAIKKGNKGICILAGDVFPIDVMSHLPVLCEDRGVPYIYVPSKEDLGLCMQTARSTCCVLILREPAKKTTDQGSELAEKYTEMYDELADKIKSKKLER